MTTFIIRYAEIGLKGKNRPDFENQLVKNIKKALGSLASTITRKRGQIFIQAKSSNSSVIQTKLSKVFGIAWFAPTHRCKSNLDSITTLALKLARIINPNQTFAIRAHRSSKDLPFTRVDLETKVGKAVRLKTKSQVDLSHPDHTIYIVSYQKESHLFTNKLKGPGGLPVGSSGKVLSLLSGGFDSIAASYLLAKRGAQVNFLHFYVHPDHSQVLKTKMKPIWEKLRKHTLSKKVFLASYSVFQFAVLNLNLREHRHELVTFRRHMIRVGEAIAKQHGYQALVLGDSLGQVASQTMENIVAVDQAANISIFRPLIGTDKIEVVRLVRQIGLEAEVIKPYKDCCSIVSTNPATKSNLEKIKSLESMINIDQITQQTLSQTKVININPTPLKAIKP